MKIAFIVQPDWLTVHFGVRNLFVSCYKILKQHAIDVDFVMPDIHGNKTNWYRVFPDSGFLTSHVKTTKLDKTKNYNKINAVPVDSINANSCKQYLGTSLKNCYDVAVITNPWLMDKPIDIDIKKQIMICYDIVANKFALNQPVLLPWGYAHNAGYQYGLRKNVHFLSISPKIDEEISDCYHPQFHSALPAILPPGFLNIPETDIVKKNIVVLAAPFDPRKGLADIPKYLNALADDIDAVHIFGRPRCGAELYDKFFKELKVPVVHYIDITNDDLIELYKSAKILLFPSLEEGLGLPILEAQVCGCPVVTTDIPPMNKNVINGYGHILTGDDARDFNEMKKLLHDNIDYKKLSDDAQTRFSAEQIYKHFMSIIKD